MCDMTHTYEHGSRRKRYFSYVRVTHMNESCHTCEWVMSHTIWMSHVTHMNATWHTCAESFHTYESVILHIRMSHVTHANVVMSHMWMCESESSSKGTHYGVATNSRLLKIIGLFCKRALQKRRYPAKETYNIWNAYPPILRIWSSMSHTWMGRVMHENESCLTNEDVMPHI